MSDVDVIELEEDEDDGRPVVKKGKVLAKVRTRNEEQENAYREVMKYRAVQKVRVANSNAFSAMVRRELYTQAEADELNDLYSEQQIADEKKMVRTLRKYMRAKPIYAEWLKYVVGVGETLAFQLIAMLDPISDFADVSHLWAYAGWHCDKEGRAVRRQAGKQSNWNDKLKVVSFQASECMMKAGGPYRELYDLYRARDEAKNGPPRKAVKGRLVAFTKGHYHKRALRYVAKIFLSHLWQAWRELEGLSVRGPYVIEYLGHKRLMSPWTFIEKLTIM
jgi:hypothetical protein